MSKLILGCGYLGLRVARKWIAAGDVVHAVTRSTERADELAREGLRPVVADVADAESIAGRLPEAETVLYAIGYDAKAGKSRTTVQLEGLTTVLDALSITAAERRATLGRLIFISTTGVYAQTGGEWVDEESECHPSREAAIVALAAEELIRGHALADQSFVLRLAGMYGPGRIPHRGDLLAGRPVAASPDDFVNLIHVDDAVSAILAVETNGAPPRTFLVSDGHPVRRCEFMAEHARLVGATPPRFEIPPPDVLAASRSGSNKRISSARIRGELRFSPRYPSFREGLAAIVGDENAKRP
jgi:nucleoside-diphosphate-sugar epimerase